MAMANPIRLCVTVFSLFLTGATDNVISNLLNSIQKKCENKIDKVACIRRHAPPDLEQFHIFPNQKELEEVYPIPGANTIGVFVMLVILAMAVLIMNTAGIVFFFRWHRTPLSRKPTEEELDAVLDADLPVVLSNHEDRPVEFQFNAKMPKDTQTIMQHDVANGQGELPPNMPIELISVANGAQNGNANLSRGGGGGRDINKGGGGGNRGGRRGNWARGGGSKRDYRRR